MVKLEVGKYYKRRDGRKVGPMVRNIDGEFRDTHPFKSPSGLTYKVDGGYLEENYEDHLDIIAEWIDEPASPVRTVTRKEIVPGMYGGVVVERLCNGDLCISLNGICPGSKSKMVVELRAAIATLTEIADAMEEQ